MNKWYILLIFASLVLVGCSSLGVGSAADTANSLVERLEQAVEPLNSLSSPAYPDPNDPDAGEWPGVGMMGRGHGRGMGWMTGSEETPGIGFMAGMHERHHAAIPQEYEGLSNPFELDDETLAAGEELYLANCASCHGETGLGDGPAGEALNPQPAPLAHSGMMLADDYLYWRIAEGGVEPPFNSAMPGWKATFSEDETWQVISYLRELSQNWVNPNAPGGRGPGRGMWGNSALMHEQMLSEAIEQGLISEQEAEVFNQVHDALEGGMMGRGGRGMGLGMEALQEELLAELVEAGTLTQEQADTFLRVHDALEEAGLMD